MTTKSAANCASTCAGRKSPSLPEPSRRLRPLSRGGTLVRLAQPIAADRVEFTVTAVRGTQRGAPAPAALSEIEVIGQGATPDALGVGR
jgi:hypothetical protein